MIAEHLQEQEEAAQVNQGAQSLDLVKPHLRYSQAISWLLTLGTLAAVFLVFWIAYQSDQRSDKAIMDNEIRGLNFRDAEQQDEIGSLRTDLTRTREGFENWQGRQ